MSNQKNEKFYFLNIDLDEKRTGIENASLLRARIFQRHLNISPIIITAKYNPRLNLQRQSLVESGLINQDTQIRNLYEYFQETNTNNLNVQDIKGKHNNKWTYKPVEKTKDCRIYNEKNEFIMYQRCDENGLLMYNNIFSNKKKVRRDTYDSNGYLSKTQQLDIVTGQVYFETYYRTNGTPCIYKHFEVINGKNNLSSIQLVDKRGNVFQVFATEDEFIAYWMMEILEDTYHHFLIIDKERIYYSALLTIDQPNISKVCMIHSSHLQENQSVISGRLNSNYAKIFEDITKPDAIVVLTEKQKEHIDERFGSYDHVVVIPHAIENNSQNFSFENRTPLRAIYLARYSKEKQHESLIRVFHLVVQHHSNAKLDLYGYGSQRSTIIEMIKTLGLEGNITVNDFAENPGDIYNTASLSVLTSRCEGFSLFILESIAHGCPVISYDVDYGPRDMIDNNINGYLVELNNEELMAQYIIEVFNNREKLESMSQASYQKAEHFNSKQIANKWATLFQQLRSKVYVSN